MASGGLTKSFQNNLFARLVDLPQPKSPKGEKQHVATTISTQLFHESKQFTPPSSPDVKTTLKDSLMKEGVLKYYQKGKGTMGKVNIYSASWRNCQCYLSSDRILTCYDNADKKKFSFDLRLSDVFPCEEEAGKTFSLCIYQSEEMQIFLSGPDFKTFMEWITVLSCASEKHTQTKPKVATVKQNFLDYKELKKRKEAAIKIQRSYRRHRARRSRVKRNKAAALIQSIIRMHLTRVKYSKEVERIRNVHNLYSLRVQSATTIQRWYRSCKYRRIKKKTPESRQKLDACFKRRTDIVRELVATEDSYVQDLDTMIRVFYLPMKALFVEPMIINMMKEENQAESPQALRADGLAIKEKSQMVTEYHLNTIFSNIEDILAVHRLFLTSLRKILENWSEFQTIGHVFIDLAHSHMVTHYIKYCNNCDTAMEMYETLLEKSSHFRTFLETISKVKRVKKLDLKGFLILPIQRLPRYILLLKDLVKHTERSHPDFFQLEQALVDMQKVTSRVDKAKTKEDARKHKNRLQQKVDEPQSISNLFESDSIFCILEGPVLYSLGQSPSKVKSYMLLFTDQIVILKRYVDISLFNRKASKNKKIYHMTYKFSEATPIPLTDIEGESKQVESDVTNNFAFNLKSKRLEYLVYVKTKDEMKNWIREINKAVKNRNQRLEEERVLKC